MAMNWSAVKRLLRADSRVALGNNPWIRIFVVWLVVVVAPDVMIRNDSIKPAYLLALIASFAMWALFVQMLAWVRSEIRPLSVIGAMVFGVFVTIAVVGTLGYHQFFRKDILSLEWEFALENPMLSWALVKTAMTTADWVAAIVMPIALTAGLLWLSASPVLVRAPWRPGRAGALAGMTAAVVLFCRPLSADLHGLRTMAFGVYGHLRSGGHPHTLPTPERVPLPPGRALKAPDIIVIIHESLGARESLREGGHASETAAFLKAHSAHAAFFSRAATVATATNVSVPTILSGLHSEATREQFARAPLLWHAARAFGYSSALFSAQEFGFAFFDLYLLGSDAPDVVRTAADYVEHAERVNELGVDDALVIDDAVEFIQNAPADRPFFMVVQFNSTHWPCWAPELDVVRWNASLAHGNDPVRCGAATRYVDRQTARLFKALEHHNRLERTLIIGTADHGEVFRPGRPLRRYSYYEDVLSVPLFIHLPESLADRAPVLHDNARLGVSNLDIYPTVLDVWGAWPLAKDDRRPPLQGDSLLRPLPGERIRVSLSDCSISRETPGFALYHGRWKWVVTEPSGVELFDLDADPDERTDLFARAPQDELRLFRSEVAKRAALQTILCGVERKSASRRR